jgi:hypothetical protein
VVWKESERPAVPSPRRLELTKSEISVAEIEVGPSAGWTQFEGGFEQLLALTKSAQT